MFPSLGICALDQLGHSPKPGCGCFPPACWMRSCSVYCLCGFKRPNAVYYHSLTASFLFHSLDRRNYCVNHREPSARDLDRSVAGNRGTSLIILHSRTDIETTSEQVSSRWQFVIAVKCGMALIIISSFSSSIRMGTINILWNYIRS
jgi:hypothetical protein